VSLDFDHDPGPGVQVERSETFGHRVLETWVLAGTAGDRVMVDAHLPIDAVQRIVVMGHGADGDRSARYIEVSGKSFTRHGTAVVAMDAPRHGERLDDPELDTLPGLGPELLEQWVRDHRRLLDEVTARWPNTPIGFAGFSMGGLFGVPLMAVDDRIGAGGIVVAGSTRVSYAPRVDLTPHQLAVLELTDPAVHAPLVDRPVLLLCAEDDEIVSVESVRALAEAFAGPSQMIVLPGTHTVWGRAAEWFRSIDRFFIDTLHEGAPAIDGR
jgi:alpha-beta hydrolase superfamily lysophospholipase